jgi:hypothetical protein
MKKNVLFFVSLFALIGCASVTIPNYIRDEHPYRKTFYAPFDTVLDATVHALEDSGWKVAKTTEPSVFERNKDTDKPGVRQILLFTDVRETALIFGTRYARMNIYVQSAADNSTEVELRYLRVTSASLKNFQNYRNDRYAEKFFGRIESLLK